MHHESYTRAPSPRKTGFPPLHRTAGVVHLCGFVSATVRHGGLQLQDRLFGETRTGWYPRIVPPRRVILDGSGWVSTAALQWLHDVGAGLCVLGRDEELIATGRRGALDAKLVRRQVRAATDSLGLRISKALLGQKIQRQARVLESIGAPVGDLRRALDRLHAAPSLDALREIESRAAAHYWERIAPTPLRFARRDLALIPPHWTTAGPHTSPLTASPRSAVTPFHAMANYLYRIGEAECAAALASRGVAAELGIVHLDTPHRASFALDALDAIRPEIEAWLLGFVRDRVFAKADFFEAPRGSVTISYDLRRVLSATASRWREEADPVIFRIARMLGAPERTRQGRPIRLLVPPRACLECGVVLDGKQTGRRFCDDCAPAIQDENLQHGREELQRRRDRGADPAHGGEAARKRGERIAQAHRDRRAARVNDDDDPRTFSRDVLLRLRGIPLSRIAQAAGVSQSYASFLRRGLRTPHPRRWPALARLAARGSPAP